MPVTTPPLRRGAVRVADVPRDVLAALQRGEAESVTLVECLALDQARLLQAAFPDLPAACVAQARAGSALGISRRMAQIGTLLLEQWGPQGLGRCSRHASDTVRGWACFMVGAMPGLPLAQRLEAIRPLADDAHFGVREWSWLAVRPSLAADLPTALAALQAWTASPSERLRRFACEALRPRGVWCAHIAALKQQPALALPLLQALRADGAAYVQDSVANWLNDAGKDQPDWVRVLCQQWLQDGAPPATQRICKRALRNLG